MAFSPLLNHPTQSKSFNQKTTLAKTLQVKKLIQQEIQEINPIEKLNEKDDLENNTKEDYYSENYSEGEVAALQITEEDDPFAFVEKFSKL